MGFITSKLVNGGCAGVKNDKALQPYPAFSPWLYSADVMLPVVDFGQEPKWSPMIKKFTLMGIPFPDWSIWALNWLQIILGWSGSLLLVAMLTGLVYRKEK